MIISDYLLFGTKKLDNDMTPMQIVEYLNKHIVGQQDAKRAIAIAMVRPCTTHLHAECLRFSQDTADLIFLSYTFATAFSDHGV